jgi:hypothetical protein
MTTDLVTETHLTGKDSLFVSHDECISDGRKHFHSELITVYVLLVVKDIHSWFCEI